MKTLNIQHSTFNIQRGHVERWALNVECWMFPAFASGEKGLHQKITRPLATTLAALIFFFTANVKAETTNGLSTAEIQGRQLAQQLCEARPTESFTKTGTLQTRADNGQRTEKQVRCEVIVTPTNWLSIYETLPSDMNAASFKLIVAHDLSSNRYSLEIRLGSGFQWTKDKSDIVEKLDFAGSDFGASDLGLEFLHWPDQKVLPKTTNLKRGRSYTLLESTNPNPSTNGYSRVRSWIDKETGGILQAEAYDTHGKLLKEFEPKSFKKVNGQWELQEMQIENVQTGSRTRLEFDLKK